MNVPADVLIPASRMFGGSGGPFAARAAAPTPATGADTTSSRGAGMASGFDRASMGGTILAAGSSRPDHCGFRCPARVGGGQSLVRLQPGKTLARRRPLEIAQGRQELAVIDSVPTTLR